MSARPVASVRAGGGAGEPGPSSLLGSLLPGGRIRPGTAVSAGGDMPLLLALAAEASTDAVGWAAVGLPQMGALAAEAAGLDLASGMRIDDPWQGAEARLQVISAVWEGVGNGHGLLRGRRVKVAAAGRGAAAAPRYAEMWLPGPDGAIALVPTNGAHESDPVPAAGAGLERRAVLRVVR